MRPAVSIAAGGASKAAGIAFGGFCDAWTYPVAPLAREALAFRIVPVSARTLLMAVDKIVYFQVFAM
ncbi:hypothetical protein C357_09732 [Citreicella sp. 357]|nr:hypothetical protein C357_09732 [Citreicella sp. 357]